MSRIQLSGNPNNNLYTISYRDPNPEQSRKVVQSLVTIFVESSLGDKREDTVNAVKFVDEQVKRYEAGLRAAEDRLKAFRLKYLGVSGTGNQDYFTRLALLTDQVAATRLQLRAAEESRDSYKRELAGEAPVLMPDMSAAPPSSKLSVPALDARLATLQSELDVLRRKYTDDHPDVTGTRRIIEQLEQQRKQEVAALAKDARPGEPASADRNPVYQQLKVALASAEANVASLRSTLASQEAQMTRLVSSARLVPQVDAEFAQLNRDYDTQKKTYEALLARRESAALGEGVADAGGTRFRVIDPPRVSPTAVFPGRAVLLGLAFVAALLAGLAGAAVANEILPTVHDPRTLATISNRPVIGMLSRFPSAAMRRLRLISNILFAGAAGTLVAAYAGVFAFTFLLGRSL
jgi:polysaccharide chain length determinant protein (PEP-CTERM system associated)